jgi:hypothetical protein
MHLHSHGKGKSRVHKIPPPFMTASTYKESYPAKSIDKLIFLSSQIPNPGFTYKRGSHTPVNRLSLYISSN